MATMGVPREKTPNSIMGGGIGGGGLDDLWALAGLKKFNVLDIGDSEGAAKDELAARDVCASVALEFKPADGSHVHVSITVSAR